MRQAYPILALCLLWPSGAFCEAPEPQSACLYAAAQAEIRHAIPGKLLQAITLVETGRGRAGHIDSWPWTTNIDSEGRYFETNNEVARYIRKQLRAGVRSIDVGCFQINTKWHGENFSSVDEMLNPVVAADYAAEFLLDLKQEFGDWNIAATKYHSRNRLKGQRYAEKLTVAQKALFEASRAEEGIDPTLLRIKNTSPDNPAGGVRLTQFSNNAPFIEQLKRRPFFFRRRR